MSDLISIKNEITKLDQKKDRRLKLTAGAMPFVASLVPSGIFFVLFLLSTTTPFAGMFGILSLLSLVAGFVLGGIGSAATMIYRSKWLKEVRERAAIGGIRASDVDWFRNEMKSEEKRALKEIRNKDLLLADAYQETLASRLTATRLVRNTKQEILLAKRRKNKLKYLQSERVDDFKAEVDKDIANLTKIKNESEEMLIEAESRLQMIEAASRRGNELAGNQLALKKLTARTKQLPLALEEAKRTEELKTEALNELEKDFETKMAGKNPLLEDAKKNPLLED